MTIKQKSRLVLVISLAVLVGAWWTYQHQEMSAAEVARLNATGYHFTPHPPNPVTYMLTYCLGWLGVLTSVVLSAIDDLANRLGGGQPAEESKPKESLARRIGRSIASPPKPVR